MNLVITPLVVNKYTKIKGPLPDIYSQDVVLFLNSEDNNISLEWAHAYNSNISGYGSQQMSDNQSHVFHLDYGH